MKRASRRKVSGLKGEGFPPQSPCTEIVKEKETQSWLLTIPSNEPKNGPLYLRVVGRQFFDWNAPPLFDGALQRTVKRQLDIPKYVGNLDAPAVRQGEIDYFPRPRRILKRPDPSQIRESGMF